jgi:tetratricopeptide (TPR) repeat protein
MPITDPQKTVFISYRRDPSRYLVRAMYENMLRHGYEPDDVFFDIESIASGEFGGIILNQIAARPHFIIVLAEGTLDRCVDPKDWLRQEIEYALTLGRNIVPIYVDGFTLKGMDQYLPGKLIQLKEFNALLFNSYYFPEAMERLRTRFLQTPVAGIIIPTPATEQKIVQELIEKVIAEPIPTDIELNAEQYFRRANTSFAKRDYETAIQDFTEALHFNPEYIAAYNNRGLAYFRSNNYDLAIADYTQALSLDPYYDTAYFNRSAAYVFKINPDAAIADLSEAVRINPNFAEAYTRRGYLYSLQGKMREAIADFNEALRLNPESAEYYTNRGSAFAQNNQLQEAIDDFNEAVELDPQWTPAYEKLGDTYTLMGNYEEALVAYTDYLRFKPKDFRVFSDRGQVYFALGRYEQALTDFKMAFEIEPIWHFEPVAIALTYHALGNVEEAKRRWYELIEFDDRRFQDIDWVIEDLELKPLLVEEARKLIAKL